MTLLPAGETTREKNALRHVMGRFATGVVLVTTATATGPSGMTVNSFTSVSLDPPLVLICVDLTSQTLPALRASGHFAVNVLAGEQEPLARCFATRSAERYAHFCSASYRVGATGSPVLDGALAFLEARIVAEFPGGDHAILLGQVVAMGTNDGEESAPDKGRSLAPGEAQEPSALVFYHSRYCRLT